MEMTRREALGAAALVGVCAPLLAACGAGSSAGTTTGTTGGSTSGSGATTSGGTGGLTLAASEVPVGGASFELARQGVIVTQPTAGTYEAFSNVCPHQQQMVSQTIGDQLVCPFHGSRFSMADGSVLGGPAPSGLQKFAVTEKSGTLHITS